MHDRRGWPTLGRWTRRPHRAPLRAEAWCCPVRVDPAAWRADPRPGAGAGLAPYEPRLLRARLGADRRRASSASSRRRSSCPRAARSPVGPRCAWLGGRWFSGVAGRRGAAADHRRHRHPRHPPAAAGRDRGQRRGARTRRWSVGRRGAGDRSALLAVVRDALRRRTRTTRSVPSTWRPTPTWCSVAEMADFLATQPRLDRHPPGARRAPPADENCWSPMEAVLRLIWDRVAGLPPPAVQPPGLRPAPAPHRDARPDRPGGRRRGEYDGALHLAASSATRTCAATGSSARTSSRWSP